VKTKNKIQLKIGEFKKINILFETRKAGYGWKFTKRDEERNIHFN
jgi:hypothetical protein